MTTFLAAGCAPMSLLITPVPSSKELEEAVVYREGAWASRKVALLDVTGLISNSRSRSIFGVEGDNPVSLFKEKLDKAAGDPAVKAVVLRINSPGGGVTASDLMYQEVVRFREKTGKPVVASMLDVAASGGYYLACGCDRIMAHPTTTTGSIGVILILPDLTGTMDKIGLDTNVIKSGPMKDSGSPLREMTEDERRYFQDMIQQSYERFLAIVAKARPNLPEDRLRTLADGRVYTADDAKENGLVDELGTLYDGIGAAKSLAGISDKKVIVVEYARPASYRPNIYAETPAAAPQINLINLSLPDWLTQPSPQLMYLWAPNS